jgi:CysZ protein
MIDAALAAFADVFSPPFRKVLFQILALTLGSLAAIFVLVHKLILGALLLPYPWLTFVLSFLTGAGLVIGLFFLLTPASFIIAGFFFDELAAEVERAMGPKAFAGRPLPVSQGLWLGLKFAGLSLVINLIALTLLLVPGVNAIAFFGANAYLLGRGYFEMAALRYLPSRDARHYRHAHFPQLILAGILLALLLTVPVFNLILPLFATAFMIRLNQGLLAPQRPARPEIG